MKRNDLETFLKTLGVPDKNIVLMADQIEKRARQVSKAGTQTYEEAVIRMIQLLKQGWAGQS